MFNFKSFHNLFKKIRTNFSPFTGLKNDIKRKIPHYVSDITDCLNIQCFATTLYLYLVSLCSLVAFGALLSKYTGNEMVKHKFYQQLPILKKIQLK